MSINRMGICPLCGRGAPTKSESKEVDEQPRHPVNLCYCCACWVPLENDSRFGSCTSSPPTVVVKNGSTVTRYPVTAKADGCNTGFVRRVFEVKPANHEDQPTLWELSERILRKPRAKPLYKESKHTEPSQSPKRLADLMGRDPKTPPKPEWHEDGSKSESRHPTVGADEVLKKEYSKNFVQSKDDK